MTTDDTHPAPQGMATPDELIAAFEAENPHVKFADDLNHYPRMALERERARTADPSGLPRFEPPLGACEVHIAYDDDCKACRAIAQSAPEPTLDAATLAEALHHHVEHRDAHDDYRGCTACDPFATALAAQYARLRTGSGSAREDGS